VVAKVAGKWAVGLEEAKEAAGASARPARPAHLEVAWALLAAGTTDNPWAAESEDGRRVPPAGKASRKSRKAFRNFPAAVAPQEQGSRDRRHPLECGPLPMTPLEHRLAPPLKQRQQ
jgi:hypothetical protein